MEAFFMPDDAGGYRLFVLHAPTDRPVHGLVVHAPPFGEEMNLSRRCVAVTSRAMAAQGFAVLVADPFACGDSSGDSGTAAWCDWESDLARSIAFLRQRWPGLPLWVWAQRAGALTLQAVMQGDHPPDGLLLWQPMVHGAELWTHWQRLVRASALAQARETGGAAADLERRWSAGEVVELGGSRVAGGFAFASRTRELLPPRRPVGGRLVWLEVQARPRPEPTAAQRTWLDRWNAAGWVTRWHAVEGPPPWLGPEVREAGELTRLSIEAIRDRTEP